MCCNIIILQTTLNPTRSVFTIMEQKLKRQIVDAAEAVKRKIRKMKEIEIDNNQALESIFKPVTEPLNSLANMSKLTALPRTKEEEETKTLPIKENLLKEDFSSIKNNDDDDDDNIDEKESNDSDSSYESLANTSYNANVDIPSLLATSDVPFGVRVVREKLMLGSAYITIDNDYIAVAGRKYRNTPGLKQLLMSKEVDLKLVTDSDLHHYKLMLLDTNAHRRDFEPTKPIKSNKGSKYMQIIKPLFTQQSLFQSKGQGLPVTKMWKKNIDLVYWNDPNELVDRLKLLIASRDAGNTGLDNEIISIIEELRESKIIK